MRERAKTITLEQLDRLSVDAESGRLYWDDKEIVTTLSLPRYVNIAIIVGALAATVGAAAGVIGAVWPIVRYYMERT